MVWEPSEFSTHLPHAKRPKPPTYGVVDALSSHDAHGKEERIVVHREWRSNPIWYMETRIYTWVSKYGKFGVQDEAFQEYCCEMQRRKREALKYSTDGWKIHRKVEDDGPLFLKQHYYSVYQDQGKGTLSGWIVSKGCEWTHVLYFQLGEGGGRGEFFHVCAVILTCARFF